MATKITLRLPERVAAQLREQSDAHGISLNETAVRAIERGLGQHTPEAEWWRALGDLVEQPPQVKFDELQIEQLRRGLDPGTGSVLDDLDWVRGDATER